jgi:heptosyltransferase-2
MKSSGPYILIVIIAGIGDLVLSSPSLRAIRKGNPDANIHLLTSTDALPIAKNNRMVDQVTAFPIRELRRNKKYLFNMIKLIWSLRRKQFTLVINLFRVSSWLGALKMGLLFLSLRTKVKIGHGKFGFGLFLSKSLPADTFDRRHVADGMLEMALQAGGITDGRGTEVFWGEGADAKWENLFADMPGEIFVGINPGGDRETRRWCPERFAAVAENIIEGFGARIILLGGPDETDIAAHIENRLSSNALVSNLSGKIPLDELPCVISKLDLMITNDSGPMHIAAATKTPLVAIFGPGDPTINGPYTQPELYRVIRKDVPCRRPCEEKTCSHLSCLDLITPEEVTAACSELLTGRSRRWQLPEGYAGLDESQPES